MLYRVLADFVVVLHFAFIVFVVVGGFVALRWRWVAWIHVPVALWGTGIEWIRWTCPLTPLEKHLRRAGGEAGYGGGFIEHYILPVIYPGDLTRGMQIGLGLMVVLVNLVAYFLLWRRSRARFSPGA